MRTIKKVPITPIKVTLMPNEMQQGNLYISQEYQVSCHLCLCGCGQNVVLPLAGKNKWTLIETDKGVSFTPSVGNFQIPCKSHYIITNNVANFV